tara:strand:- start:25 stop:852 length:828 start_codon:yes stop_codon:yes gene_type:complete
METLNNYRNTDPCRITENGECGVLKKIFELIGRNCNFCVEFGAGDGKKYSVTYPFRQNGSNSLLMDGCVIMDSYVKTKKTKKREKQIKRLRTSADASEKDIKDSIYDVKLEFITKENINDLFKKYNVPEKIDLLVIDIDGNDYYVWKELNHSVADIVVIEFNQWIDPNLNIVMKYNKDFKTKIGDKHISASCKAMYNLGRSKGYTLVEVLEDNMFFVKNNLADMVTVGKGLQNNWRALYHNSSKLCENGVRKIRDYNKGGNWMDLDSHITTWVLD